MVSELICRNTLTPPGNMNWFNTPIGETKHGNSYLDNTFLNKFEVKFLLVLSVIQDVKQHLLLKTIAAHQSNHSSSYVFLANRCVTLFYARRSASGQGRPVSSFLRRSLSNLMGPVLATPSLCLLLLISLLRCSLPPMSVL